MFKLLVQRVPTIARSVNRNVVALPALPAVQRRFFSGSDKSPIHKDKVIPENFFDEELEVEREFLDFARSLEEGGLDKLTVTKHISSKSGLEKLLARDDIMSSVADLDALDPKVRDALLAFKGIGVVDADDDDSSDVEDPIRERMELEYDPAYDSEYDEEKVPFNGKREEFESDEEEEEHRLQNPEEHLFMPHGDSNPTETVRRGYLYPDELLHDFIPATHSERHNSTNQGSRACPGKLQRRGRFPVLKCHKIDLDELTYLDVLSLKEYLTEDGEIIPKKGTGLCSKCQRRVAKTIKAARNFGLLPHIGQFVVSDSKPKLLRKDAVHQPFVADSPVVVSKTLL